MSLRSAWLEHAEAYGPDKQRAFEAGYVAGRMSCRCSAEQHGSRIEPAERNRLVGPYDPDAALSAGGET